MVPENDIPGPELGYIVGDDGEILPQEGFRGKCRSLLNTPGLPI